jgi:hypothetical protein
MKNQAPCCITCERSVAEVSLFRTNEVGVPARWKCAACITPEDRRQIAANETARKCRALAHSL